MDFPWLQWRLPRFLFLSSQLYPLPTSRGVLDCQYQYPHFLQPRQWQSCLELKVPSIPERRTWYRIQLLELTPSTSNTELPIRHTHSHSSCPSPCLCVPYARNRREFCARQLRLSRCKGLRVG